MADSGQTRRDSSQRIRRPWCCSFGTLPKSPENLKSSKPSPPPLPVPQSQKSLSVSSFPNSPQINKVRVSRIDPRRILSPGRVSPIGDSDLPINNDNNDNDPAVVTDVVVIAEPLNVNGEGEGLALVNEKVEEVIKADVCSSSVYDVRLSLKGKSGECLVLELDSEVLSANSSVFANLILDCRKREGDSVTFCRIEVPEVQNLSVFHDTIELMFEEDITRRLRKMGVSRSIDVLEVAAGIMFTKGVLSCLKYIEAVPWSESEEDKLRSLFTRFTFDDTTTRDVLARLSLPDHHNNSNDSSQHLAIQLIRSVTTGNDTNSRSELKTLVKDLFAKSSVYEKDLTGLEKQDLYAICQSCLNSLVSLFKGDHLDSDSSRTLIERISREVDSINWLLEILLDQQMAEDFIDIWAEQDELVQNHGKASPMVRYELSRVSAWIFIALGKGKLHIRTETRVRVFQTWFKPMLVDFGWLQRCRKGLDIKVLEEGMGQGVLTLPMKNQHDLFMEWFRCFSKQGSECPNLGKAFQIWWRRSSKCHDSR
ncbi:hypothetical protein ACHQM5_022259 [Ranunculus cassubicifolius]